MKYTPGDTVLLLHSNEEAEVTEIINEEMVMVKIGAVQFPVYTDQIDFPYFKRFTEKKFEAPKKKIKHIDQIKKEKNQPKNKIATGVWLSFLPIFDKDIFDDDVVKEFKIYLLNQTADTFHFSYQNNFKNAEGFHLNNTIHPFTDFYIHDIPFEAMNDGPRFEFDFSLDPPDKKRATHFEAFHKIKAKNLFQKIEEIRLKNEPTFSVLLFEQYPDRAPDLAPEYNSNLTNLYSIARVREKLQPPRSVIDLHIEKLTDSWKSMNNFEILTLQLNTFEKFYQLAISHKQPNLIIIHGVGKGKLRTEIHEKLKYKKEVKSFANQFHPDFGFGATEIFFQYF